IPLVMIRAVLEERKERRNSAVNEISSTWGGPQTVVGPVLVIPYHYRVDVWKDQVVNGKREQVSVTETRTANAYFLPATLDIEGALDPSTLHRGIYDAVVYKGTLNLSGTFARPDFAGLDIADQDVLWSNAVITMAVSDLRGTGEMLGIEVGGTTRVFSPGCRLEGHTSGITAPAPWIREQGGSTPFRMSLSLKGSRSIVFAPVGQQNKARLTSTWPDPSFQGAFLPATRTVTSAGFDAVWEVSWYGRQYPQHTVDQGGRYAFTDRAVSESCFGVDLVSPVDAYRMAERAIKYGVLFIALMFTAFFLFEIIARLRIHPVQYLLIGAALCLFYLALLSLSEFILFGWAYWIGVIASALLVTLYSMAVLKSGRRTAVIAVAQVAIYAFLYVVLQLQDYSLLFGTAALFAVLGIVMFVTRRMEWYGTE
ncbi:cell envelope integrity protein CreD, partial [bacterium]|nr:cell envelope integrity protein CreD [bacterium]